MFGLIFTLAALIVPAAPPDGVYKYVSSMNGATIGKTAISVARRPSGDIVLTENGSGNMNGQSGSIQDTLTLDPQLAPASYVSLASIADSKSMKANLSFSGDQASQTGDVTKTYNLAADAKHFVLMDFGPFSGFFAIPAQMQAWHRSPVIAIVPIYAQGLPLTVDAALAPDRPDGVPLSDRQITFSSMFQITLWYEPHTMVVDEVDVPAQGVSVKRAP